MARQIVVDIVGDSSKFTKATGDAITKTDSLSGKLKNAGKGVTMGVGIAAFGLLSTAISGAIGMLGDAHQAFLDDQVSATNLANAVKNNVPGAYQEAAKAAEEFAGAQGKLGFADDDVRDSLSQLVGTTHDVEEASRLSALAMDLARAKGIDLATATDAVQKASEGQGRALKALGVDVGTTTNAADLLRIAQDNVKGSAEAWAATSEGKTAAAQVKVGEAMEKVGMVIDQVAQVVIPVLAEALTGIIDVFSQVWTAIQPVISTIMSALVPAFQTAASIGKSVMAAIISAVRAVAPVFSTVFGVIGNILKVAGGAFNAWKAVVGAVFSIIIGVIKTAVGIFETEFKIVGAAIGVLGKVFNAFSQLVGRVFSVIGGIVKSAINAVIGIVNGVIGAINSIQVHIHVGPVNLDWNGLNIGRIPKLHEGGVVGGSGEQLRMLTAGETVLPKDSPLGGGGNVIINIEQFVGSDSEMERFADRVALRTLRLRPTG